MSYRAVIIVAIVVLACLAVFFLAANLSGFFTLTGLQQTDNKTVQVGAVLPLTGSNARYGALERTGLEMALQEINNSGGINGKKLEILFEDSRGEPKDAVSAWQKLSINSNLHLVVSGLSSACTVLSPLANSDKTVLLATDCAVAQYSSSNDFTFRISSSNAREGRQMAEYLLSRGINSIAAMKINNDYAAGLFPTFEKSFSPAGKIKILQSYAPEQRDFRTELEKINDANVQAIYLISYAPDAEIILKQMKELGMNLQVFSTEPIENSDFLKNAGTTAEGVIYLKAALTTPNGKDFAEKAKAAIGRYPEINIARTYDALDIAAVALAECDKTGQLNGECVKEHLFNTKDYSGVLGTISFDENGDVNIPYQLKTVRGGKFVEYEG